MLGAAGMLLENVDVEASGKRIRRISWRVLLPTRKERTRTWAVGSRLTEVPVIVSWASVASATSTSHDPSLNVTVAVEE
jgi:hypothetical protein